MKDEADSSPSPAEPEPVPLSLKETLAIVLSGHIGVRKAEQRAEDFRRANGLRVFVAAALYFTAIVIGLVLLVRYLAS